MLGVELLQAETLLGLAGRLGDLPDVLDFGHEQVVVGVKMVVDYFEFSAVVKTLVNQYVVDHRLGAVGADAGVPELGGGWLRQATKADEPAHRQERGQPVSTAVGSGVGVRANPREATAGADPRIQVAQHNDTALLAEEDDVLLQLGVRRVAGLLRAGLRHVGVAHKHRLLARRAAYLDPQLALARLLEGGHVGGHVQRDQGSDPSTFARIFPWWAKDRVASDRHGGVGTEPRLLNGHNVERASEALLLQLVHLLIEAAGDVERAHAKARAARGPRSLGDLRGRGRQQRRRRRRQTHRERHWLYRRLDPVQERDGLLLGRALG